MKAIRIQENGGAEKLTYGDYQQPIVTENEIVVKNEVAGINFIDIYERQGLYKTQLPLIPGHEGSGVVVDIGKAVTDFNVGDRVAYIYSHGAYAEYTSVPAGTAVKLPAQIDFATAAAVMLQGLTADYLTHSTFKLSANDTLLIHAGAGGVGLLVIQIAKMLGATVITTVSTPAKMELAKEAGADHVIIYTQEDFVTAVKKITNGKGVDVVYDSVGKTTFLAGLTCLKPRGMMVSFGQASGSIPPFDVTELSKNGSLFLSRPRLNNYIATAAELRERSDRIFNYLINKQLKLHIYKKYPLADAKRAQQDLEQRLSTGKLILEM